ncbi:XdhC Xanthine and CO dehydrogenases maturation factor, XdhC/CoxF family [Burkholderiaceae bacterium]
MHTLSSDALACAERLRHGQAILVSVEQGQGSVPRENGAWMAVFADQVIGTIGGGHLEWSAIASAQAQLPTATEPWHDEVALGPSLGQCCGGRVRLRFEPISAQDRERLSARLLPTLHPVTLFGGGHVGHAIVQALAPLPFAVHWVDSRDGVFPDHLPNQTNTEHSEPVHLAVRDIAPHSRVLIMSFSHAEDLDIVAACLQRQRERHDLPLVGLIGSQTKRATFSRRLRERGFGEDELQHITCPIGLPGITGKAPAVIGASVAAQLLMHLYTI